MEASPVDLLDAIARDRDRAAFAALFALYAPRLKRYMLQHGASDSRAEELVQEVMLVVWRKADRYDPRRASVNTWLFTIARNKRIDALRRQRRPEPDPTDPAFVPSTPPPADERVEARERTERVRAALATLPPDQAEVILRAYFDDESMRAIAESAGIAVGTVKSRARLAMGRLRRSLQPTDPGDG